MDVAAAAGMGELSVSPVQTVDDDFLPARHARSAARFFFLAGFAALPWFWAVSCWLYWPSFWGPGGDPVIKSYTRRGALWFVVYTCLFLPWMLLYLIGRFNVLGQSAYDKLNINSIDLAGAGLGAG